jgi:hypothetical protein
MGAKRKLHPQNHICCICFSNRTKPLVLKPCGHTAHIKCLNQWQVTKPTCPVCKITVSNYTPVLQVRPALPPEPYDDFTQMCSSCGQYIEWNGLGCRYVRCLCGNGFVFTKQPRRPKLRTFIPYLLFFMLIGLMFSYGCYVRDQMQWKTEQSHTNSTSITEQALEALVKNVTSLEHQLQMAKYKVNDMKAALALKEAASRDFNLVTTVFFWSLPSALITAGFYRGILRIP